MCIYTLRLDSSIYGFIQLNLPFYASKNFHREQLTINIPFITRNSEYPKARDKSQYLLSIIPICFDRTRRVS